MHNEKIQIYMCFCSMYSLPGISTFIISVYEITLICITHVICENFIGFFSRILKESATSFAHENVGDISIINCQIILNLKDNENAFYHTSL